MVAVTSREVSRGSMSRVTCTMCVTNATCVFRAHRAQDTEFSTIHDMDQHIITGYTSLSNIRFGHAVTWACHRPPGPWQIKMTSHTGCQI
ncbi:hypothetical protein G9A89_000368 [Geosiphon pyriformis]|nr:hypothetical protein G9A89_000368 [Geosiphon pyriformis]